MAAVLFGAGVVDVPRAYAGANLNNVGFDFEAHRGGRDARPENTLYSYAYALEMGVTSIECDMQLTKDGVIVMSHNPILNHEITKDADGKYVEPGKYDIRQMTLAEVKQFTVGEMDTNTEYYKAHGQTQVRLKNVTIPTLEELLQLIQSYGDKKVMLNIETKSYPDPEDKATYANNPDPKHFVQVFYDTIKKYDMQDRVILESFDWQTLVEMKKLDPTIPTSALWCQQPSWGRTSEFLRPYEKGKSPWLAGMDIDDYKGNAVEATHAIAVDVISPYYTELSKDNVDLAHKYGMKVIPWTVNDATDMNMLLDMGVDGIITDRPWVLRDVLQKRGIAVHDPIVNAASPYHTGTEHVDVVTEKVAGGMDAAY